MFEWALHAMASLLPFFKSVFRLESTLAIVDVIHCRNLAILFLITFRKLSHPSGTMVRRDTFSGLLASILGLTVSRITAIAFL